LPDRFSLVARSCSFLGLLAQIEDDDETVLSVLEAA